MPKRVYRYCARVVRNLEALPDVSERSGWVRFPLALALIAGAAAGALSVARQSDATASEILLLSVCLIAWMCGYSAGLLSAVAAAVSFAAGMQRMGASSDTPIGDAIVSLSAFLMTAWLSSAARGLLRTSNRRVAALDRAISARDSLEARLMESNLALTTSNGELANAVKAHDRFLASMSHEIRTPLNGVLGMLRVLNQTDLDPRQREFASGAARSAERLLNLVNELLAMGLAAPTTIDAESHAFDMSELVASIVETYSAIAAEKGVILSSSYGERVPRYVMGPQRAIEQVLSNLVTNAIKFTERGGVWILVEGTMRIGGTVDFRLSVVDSGRGMTAEELEHVFDGAGRADPEERARRNGAGLGLGIARQLVTQMNGTLDAISTPGSGSRFDMQMQLALDKRQRHYASVQSTSSTAGALVIGEDDTDTIALQEMLRRISVWTDTASTVDHALMLLDEVKNIRPYSLAILMSNAALRHAELLHEFRRRGTPVIAIEISDAETSALFANGIDVLGSFSRDNLIGVVETAHVRLEKDANTAGAVVDQPQNQSRSHTLTPAFSAVIASNSRAPRALVVDDEPMNLLVLRELLTMLGIEAECVDSGELAIRRLEQEEFPIVFMDMRMPTLSGPEATRRIRQFESVHGLRAVPIVATTANSASADREQCRLAGMSDFLTKPIDPAELAAVLERWHVRPIADPTGGSMRRAPAVEDVDEKDELMEVFLSSAAGRLADLRTAIISGDFDAASLAAHTLKSMSRHMGFTDLADVSADLEANVESMAADTALELASRAEALFAEVSERA